ncbi:hypothetical protein [Sulfuritalea sp.]|uniref:hypothetical protein n=1 Tax=Sulfuritalea sp. TaxID=2480090 RepID=UPI00286E75AD|nr:hypothetical protein [Sulfuritalea sp.]
MAPYGVATPRLKLVSPISTGCTALRVSIKVLLISFMLQIFGLVSAPLFSKVVMDKVLVHNDT